MTKADGSVRKAPRSSGSRTRRPKAAQSVTKEVSPEAIERMAKALAAFVCAVDHPNGVEVDSDSERPSRAHRGAEYLAAIAEQRPGIEGHGYPGGYPDWDQVFRLSWSGATKVGEFSDDRSIMLPDWMALPLVRRLLEDPELWASFMGADKPDETDPGKIKNA